MRRGYVVTTTTGHRACDAVALARLMSIATQIARNHCKADQERVPPRV